MKEALWQLLRERLPWQATLVFILGVSALVGYWDWIVKLTPQHRSDLAHQWWVFALIVLAMFGGLAVCLWFEYRPLPKRRGHVRLLVSAQADTPAGRAVSLALIPKLQRLLEALKIQRRVDVWLVPAMATDAKADEVIHSTNADAVLWVSTVPADSAAGVIHPRWRMRTSARPLFRSELMARSLDAGNPDSLNSVAEQIALEALDMLRPALGDWLEDANPSKSGTGGETRIPEPEAEMSLLLTVSRWSPTEGALGRATEAAGGERLLFAMWARNHSDQIRTNFTLELPLPPEVEYLPGFLTLNGSALSEVGAPAQVDAQNRRATFSIGKLGPGQRVLATVGVTLKPGSGVGSR